MHNQEQIKIDCGMVKLVFTVLIKTNKEGFMMMPAIRKNFGFDLFDEMFKDPFFNRLSTASNKQSMKTDIKEKDGNYLMEIDLPGFQKEDIRAELNKGYLTVTAEHNENKEKKDEEGNYIYRERSCGQCSRSFYVGDYMTEEEIKGSFKDGTLTLTFPKEEQQKLEDHKKLISIE